MKCSTCGHCNKRVGFLIVRFYCKRYKRNMNGAAHCIDWRPR